MTVSAIELKELSIKEIAKVVIRGWLNVNYAAAPYLEAMLMIESIDDRYYADSAYSVVAYFLSNASQYKGDEAKLVKGELKARMKVYERLHGF